MWCFWDGEAGGARGGDGKKGGASVGKPGVWSGPSGLNGFKTVAASLRLLCTICVLVRPHCKKHNEEEQGTRSRYRFGFSLESTAQGGIETQDYMTYSLLQRESNHQRWGRSPSLGRKCPIDFPVIARHGVLAQ